MARRSNQFDPDAYGKPPQRVGCSPVLLLLGIGMLVFLFIQVRGMRNRGREREAVPANTTERGGADSPSNARINEDFPRADKDDWLIEEVDSAKKTNPGLLDENLPDANARLNPRDTGLNPGERTDEGDWSIEEVGSTERPAKPKSTKKGDWEIEEVAE